MDYKNKLADRVLTMNTSAIRELFKVLNVPGMISLAGGIPAPETFPIDIIKDLNDIIIKKYGAQIFQYGITEGWMPLREALLEWLAPRKVAASVEEIFISPGAQSAIDACAKVLINKDDIVLVESPTFLATIKTFKTYEPKLLGLPMDDEGIIIEAYAEMLQKNKVKLTYLIPNFQNPSGRTLSLARRKAIAELAIKHNSLIIEDDPYYELRYQGEHLPTLRSLAPENVVYIGSLSKVFSPGMRLGYYTGPKEITSLMTSARQGVDVHANAYAQALAAEYIAAGHLSKHLPEILAKYEPRLRAMLISLSNSFPNGFTFSKPEGGMFVWVEGPQNFVSYDIYDKAIENKVAFVPGHFFFTDENQGRNTMRLNFTNVSEDNIKTAISKLALFLN